MELNRSEPHAQPEHSSDLIEIFNPYASYQISTFLSFDQHFQFSLQSNPILKSQENLIRLDNEKRNQQEDADLAFALSLQTTEIQQQEEIQRQRLIEDEKLARDLENEFKAEEIAAKQREEDENIEECSCCCSEYPFDAMVHCKEGHLVCARCVERSIETALLEGQVRTSCPSIGCTSDIPLTELERVLPAKLMKRLDETEAMNALFDIPNLRTCWKCAYKVIDEDTERPLYCPQCSELTCKKCNKRYHPNLTCEEATRDPLAIVTLKMSEAVVKVCPRCKLQIIKDEGCNHMTCPRCRTEFCYVCGADITGHVGEHFLKCNQFNNNNIEYNNQLIQKAREKAMIDLHLTGSQ